MLERLREIAKKRMPTVAELLKDAASAPKPEAGEGETEDQKAPGTSAEKQPDNPKRGNSAYPNLLVVSYKLKTANPFPKSSGASCYRFAQRWAGRSYFSDLN